jgi:RNA polymerase sigma-70 factor (ECF subfamily)
MSEERQNRKFSDFFKTERLKMVNYVRGLIDDAADKDGEDIVQDVMLNLFNKADITVPIENLSAYIYQSLRNRVVDLLRNRKFEKSIDETNSDNISLSGLIHDSRYEAASEFEKKDMREEIFTAIDSLDEESKALIFLTEFEGKSFREISEEWDIPIGTLLSKKSRAIAKIRGKLIHLKNTGYGG